MTARSNLFLHLPDSLWLSKRDGLLDAYRAEVLAEAKVETVAWLVKKATEQKAWDAAVLASKIDRGAVRGFLGTAHYRDALDEHRAEVLHEAAAELDRIAEHYGPSAQVLRDAAGNVRYMAGKDTGDATQAPAGESTQLGPNGCPFCTDSSNPDLRDHVRNVHPDEFTSWAGTRTLAPLAVRWDREVIHPASGTDEPTLVCCIAADTGQPVGLFLDDEHREALGLMLVDPDGEMDQADDDSAPPDFFQPGHSYTHRDGTDFRTVTITTHPNTGEPRALGWIVRNGWHEPAALDPDDWTQYDGYEPPAEGEAARD